MLFFFDNTVLAQYFSIYYPILLEKNCRVYSDTFVMFVSGFNANETTNARLYYLIMFARTRPNISASARLQQTGGERSTVDSAGEGPCKVLL